MTVLDLTEWSWAPLGEDGAAIAAAVRASQVRGLEVAPPDPLAGEPWRLRSTGLVGYLPLGAGLPALRIAPKVPIASLVMLLERAYDLGSLRWQPGVTAAATIEGLYDVLLGRLCELVGARLRRGLYRAYVETQDELAMLRGRLAVPETLGRAARGSVRLVCDFEELTEDLDDNRLILWTLERARRVGLGRPSTRAAVRALHRSLSGAVTLTSFAGAACEGRAYHRLNADYRPIHALCRAVLDACGEATAGGPADAVPFTVDMPRLFERFAARWLAAELAPWRVEAQHRFSLDADLSYSIDVVVRDPITRRAVAVLDTKYKDHNRPAPADVQQVVFYATVLGCADAWLWYPRAVPHRTVTAGGVRVHTCGLDLARPATWPAVIPALARTLAAA